MVDLAWWCMCVCEYMCRCVSRRDGWIGDESAYIHLSVAEKLAT